jgi:translation initiation factor 2 subunit 3
MDISLKYSDIIKNQPTINIGMCGHVSHGKSTLIYAITGVKTQKHSAELKRNITIKINSENAKIFWSPTTGKYYATSSRKSSLKDKETGEELVLIKHYTHVDVPGHEAYISTMINGSNLMDNAFLLIAGNEPDVPQKQTIDHLDVLTRLNINNIAIIQNKLDLTSKEEAKNNYNKIKNFTMDTIAENSTIIPISAQRKYNIDSVLNYIANFVDEPIREYNKPVSITVIRSFDVNNTNIVANKLIGAVIGGTIRCGIVRIGDYLELRPGLLIDGKPMPIITKVVSLYSDNKKLNIAVPGGLIGIGTTIDPYFGKDNKLVGQTAGKPGTLSEIYRKIRLQFDENIDNKFKKKERLCFVVNNLTIYGIVSNINQSKKIIELYPEVPICIELNCKIAIIQTNTTGITYSTFIFGKPCKDIILPVNYGKYIEEAIDYNVTIDYDIEKHCNSEKDDIFNYDTLLNNINSKVVDKKIKVDANTLFGNIKIMSDNKSLRNKTIYSTFEDLCNKIYSCPKSKVLKSNKITKHNLINVADLFQNFIESELSTTTSINKNKALIIRGKYTNNQLRSLIIKFIQQFVICKHCSCTRVFLFKKDRRLCQYCNTCKSTITIEKI